MKIHKLKIKSEYFDEIANGNKTFEIRYNDREFQKGDVLELIETNILNMPTTNVVHVLVKYVFSDCDDDFLKPGFVLLGIRVLESFNGNC